MKRVLLTFAVLVALAVCVAPAFAKPSTSTELHSLKWRGSGVTLDNPSTLAQEIIGERVAFDGTATVNSVGSWTGGGTFLVKAPIMSRKNPDLKANLGFNGGDYDATNPNQWRMYGLATVTTGGQTYTDVFFELTIDTSVPSYGLVIESPDMSDIPWLYWVSPCQGNMGRI